MDPIQFTQSKVLCELHEPWTEVDPFSRQTEVNINMRIALAEWMAEVCVELDLEPEVFCLAVSCLDRFLSVVELRVQQLQLLGVSCLLVAWKVRGEHCVNVDALVRLTAESLLKQEILECEMLVLTKLNWNLPSVVAVDFIHHILQKLELKIPENVVRDQVLNLLQTCYIHPTLAVRSPQLLAAAAVIHTVRPMLTMPPPSLETPPLSYSPPTLITSSLSASISSPQSFSPSPTPSTSSPTPSTSSTPPSTSTSKCSRSSSENQPIPPRKEKARRKSSSKIDKIIRSIQRVTLSDKTQLQEVLEDMENLVTVKENRAILNVTPSPDKMAATPEKSAAGSQAAATRNLFQDFVTPTKIIDASNFNKTCI